MRRKIIAANWKMNLDRKEVIDFAKMFKKGKSKVRSKADVIIFPNALFISTLVEEFKKSKTAIGAQNCFYEDKGAFTGENSVKMIKSVGAQFVLCGHSERRILFGESDEMIAKKVAAILGEGLNLLLCIGEDLSCRNRNGQNEKVAEQLSIALGGIDKKYLKKIVIAYEPVWAIGTGVTATVHQAQEIHAFIRKELKKIGGPKAASIPILYGGSCNPTNAKELFSCKDVDGGLIGGASLDANSFLKIVASI